MINEISDPEQSLEPKKCKTVGPHRLGYLLFTLCFLIGLALLPSLAQRISYAIYKGQERAEREEALLLLKAAPEVTSRIPWVVKQVGPGVVGLRLFFQQELGVGTGVIIDKTGHILTNLHVIRKGKEFAHQMEIRLLNGETLTKNINVVGYDENHDLALLKVSHPDFQPITWGDSEKTLVGDTVLTIGNPYGLEHSVARGIVSATKRYTIGKDNVITQEYLQTDAVINPGNSGGPLVNVYGQVIGINTAILGETYQGISFAIPAKIAQRFCEELLKKQSTTK